MIGDDDLCALGACGLNHFAIEPALRETDQSVLR
jgi:hypothetical protein